MNLIHNNYTNINNAIVEHIMNLKDSKGKLLPARGTYLAIYFELQKWWNISFKKEGYKLKCLWRSVSKLSASLGYGRNIVSAACIEFEKMGILIRIPNGLENGYHFVMLGNYEEDTKKPTHAPNIRARALLELNQKIALGNTFEKGRKEDKEDVPSYEEDEEVVLSSAQKLLLELDDAFH